MELINWTAGVCHFYFIKFEFFYTVLRLKVNLLQITIPSKNNNECFFRSAPKTLKTLYLTSVCYNVLTVN